MGAQDISDLLTELAIDSIHIDHPKIATVEDYRQAGVVLPDQGVKNLFLKNKKGTQHYLLVVLDDRDQVKLEDVAEQLGETRLSFASAERLQQYLGVEPGCVSPFGLLNDTEHHVAVLLDDGIDQEALLGFHPLVNTATECISYQDFMKFLKHIGYTPRAVTIR